MNGKTVHLKSSHIYKRRCVACGYDGGLLHNGLAPRCARCSCDLSVRPAMSYAEMEGIIGESGSPGNPGEFVFHSNFMEPLNSNHKSKLIERWLLFIFISMLMFFLLAVFASAAFNI